MHGECGEFVARESEDGNSQHLQVLERARQIEERLRARADGYDRMTGERSEVGTHVAVEVNIAMHSTDSSGGKHTDTCASSEQERCRHRCCAYRPALPDGECDLALANLSGWSEDAFVFRFFETHSGDAVEDGGDCGNSASFPDRSNALRERGVVGR
jgi:hypothetical protein